MKRRAHQLLALVLGSVAVAACGTSSDLAVHRSLAALATTTPQAPPPSVEPALKCTNLTASLRPPASVPAPGAMPARSWMARIQHRGYLIAGVNAGDYGFGYLNPFTGKIEGFEIDLVRELASAILGNRRNIVQLKALTVNQRMPAVLHGSVDIVVDDFTITCYRRTKVDVSNVYYDNSQRVLVPGTGSRVRGLQDLGGKRVCASAGSADIDAIKKASSHPKLVVMDQAIDCLVALQQGGVDAISTDDSILLGFHKQDPDTTIVGPPVAPAPYGMVISPAHPEFVRFVNGVLARLRADGTWKKLYSRWLGGSTPNPPPATYDG